MFGAMKNASVSAPTHDEISARARQLWDNAGQPAGRDEEFWLQAERELQNGIEKNGRAKTSAKRTSATAATATM
jgi:hypothetical protein